MHNGDIFGVMFRDASGNLAKLETVDGTPIATEFTVSGLTDDLYSGTMNFSTGNFTVAESVPEPTSAMLLLLGMAGLALRRRRA